MRGLREDQVGRGGEGKAKGRPGGMVWFAKEKGAGGGRGQGEV